MEWITLSFPGQRVVAVPHWGDPRLFVPAGAPWERWRKSAIYPAFRIRARLFRTLQRLKAAGGVTPSRRAPRNGTLLVGFLHPELPQGVTSSILVGTPGPAQKLIVTVWDACSRPIAYVKYGETPAAMRRIKTEFAVLSALPESLGPKPLKLAPLGDGLALLMTAVPGQHLPARLPPPQEAVDFLHTLSATQERVQIQDHPWAQRTLTRPREAAALPQWLEVLARRDRPVVRQHGDFAPWNLLRLGRGRVRAIDWEYGSADGFPHADLAYYNLQVGALIYRWSPAQTFAYAQRYFSRTPSAGCAPGETEALLRLTAWHAYCQALEDGHAPGSPLQVWRRALWSADA